MPQAGRKQALKLQIPLITLAGLVGLYGKVSVTQEADPASARRSCAPRSKSPSVNVPCVCRCRQILPARLGEPNAPFHGFDRHGDDVVAVDDAWFGEAPTRSDRDLGPEASRRIDPPNDPVQHVIPLTDREEEVLRAAARVTCANRAFGGTSHQ